MQLRFGQVARFGQSAAQVGLRVSIVWMQADSRAIVLNCFDESILRGKSICQIVMSIKIVWLRPKGSIQIWQSLANSSRGQERGS